MLTIALPCGRVVLIDDADAWVTKYRWSAHDYGYPKRYAVIDGKYTKVFLHREILQAPKGVEVDHINGDPLDNRRQNLRLCSRSENMRNARRRSDNTSGFKGVSFDRKRKMFEAYISHKGKKRSLGFFDDIETAHGARLKAAHQIYGEFACENRG